MTDLYTMKFNLTETQQKILNAIWEKHLETGKWAFCRHIHHDFGRKASEQALENLGGSIVFRLHDSEAGKDYYQLSLLGVLLTSDGDECEQLLIIFLTFLGNRFGEDPDYDQVTAEEVKEALKLTNSQSKTLSKLIDLGYFWGNNASFGSDYWSAGVPDDIDRFREIDLHQYIRDKAMERYDPEMPVNTRKMGHIKSDVRSTEELKPSILDKIISDQELFKLCSPQIKAGNMSEAVKTALGEFERRMRRFRSRKRDGELFNIIAQLFKPDGGEYHFPFCEKPGHQNGIMFLYQGTANALRNLTHHQGLKVDDTEALNIIGLVNYLLVIANKAKRGSFSNKTAYKSKRAKVGKNNQHKHGVQITPLYNEPTCGFYHSNEETRFHLFFRVINNSSETIEIKQCLVFTRTGEEIALTRKLFNYNNKRDENFVMKAGEYMSLGLQGKLSKILKNSVLPLKIKLYNYNDQLLAENDVLLSARLDMKSAT